ncbi:MAG: hypothetical protein JWP62_296 [Blastococcus sp.]|nr:hypothetical protein [Blastococcus sp.]
MKDVRAVFVLYLAVLVLGIVYFTALGWLGR